jgi:hypothetical protein
MINSRLIGLRNWRVHIAAVIEEYEIPIDGDALPVAVVGRRSLNREQEEQIWRLFEVRRRCFPGYTSPGGIV